MLNPFINSAEDRPLLLRNRADVEWSRLFVRGGSVAVASDGVGVREWFLKSDEAWLCSLIQPGVTWRELQKSWEARYAPRRVNIPLLQQIVERLFQSGLLLSDLPRSAEQFQTLHDLDTETRRGKWWANILTWRGPGIDPTAVLNSISRIGHWLISRLICCVLLLLCMAGIWIVFHDWTILRTELVRLSNFGPMRSILTWLCVISAIKVLHELGHAVVARACGVRCHTIGLLLLCGIPTLYCQVGNVWSASRRERLWINAGGMIVELWLATLGIIVWSASVPGLTHDLGLQVALFCTLNTFLLNGNPLLRYDGYYLLSDAAAIPNLREQSTRLTIDYISKLLRLDDSRETLQPSLQEHSLMMRWLLVAFCITSTIYRWVLAWGLVWFAAKWLAPHELSSPKWLLGGMFLALFLGIPLMQFWKWFRRPRREHPFASLQFWVRLGLVVTVIAAAVTIRWPATVSTYVVIEPQGNSPIVTTVAGKLVQIIDPGTYVKPGDRIAKLENAQLEQERTKWRGEYELNQLRVANLEKRQDDPKAAAELTTARTSVTAAKQQLDEFERQAARLVIRAPQSGCYYPPETQLAESNFTLVNKATGILKQQPGNEPLSTWQGTVNDPKNTDAWVATGTNIGSIGDGEKCEAWGMLEQADLPLVQIGQRVRLRIHSAIERNVSGTVIEIAALPVDRMNGALWEQVSGKFELQNQSRKENEHDPATGLNVNPVASSYYLRIRCDTNEPSESNDPNPLSNSFSVGAIGRAHIEIVSQSLVERARHWFVHTFQWEF